MVTLEELVCECLSDVCCITIDAKVNYTIRELALVDEDLVDLFTLIRDYTGIDVPKRKFKSSYELINYVKSCKKRA